MSYDYVVVGAGAAGCVLAERLSADPNVSVLLVEDGGRGRNPLLSVPRAFAYTLRSARHVHRYPTRRTADVPAEWWVRGRGLGGSTAVNGLMYLRGAQADFDGLAATVGDAGWGWQQFLAAYRSIEDHALGASGDRGAGGPLGVSVPSSDDSVVAALMAASASAGLRIVDDVNGSDTDRIGFTPATIAQGRRVSAATAFLRPVRRRPNLTIATRARVDRVLFDGTTATGVVVTRGAHSEEVAARREVILSAGTIESPLILERSGIGRPDILRAAGIDLRVDSPRVGEGVIEHRGVSLQVRFREQIGSVRLTSRADRAREAARYLVTRRGPIATSGYDIVSQFRSSSDLDRPDVQGVWVPLAIDETADDTRPARYPGLLFTGYGLRPTSTGSIHVATTDLMDPPVIEPQALEHPAEQLAVVATLQHARDIIEASDLADLVADEVFPTPAVSTPEQIIAHSRAHGGGIYHAVGSCAMGTDDAVVDTTLRVRGTDRLRVVDASVLPHQVSGNTAAPVMATAWIAAKRIRDS